MALTGCADAAILTILSSFHQSLPWTPKAIPRRSPTCTQWWQYADECFSGLLNYLLTYSFGYIAFYLHLDGKRIVIIIYLGIPVLFVKQGTKINFWCWISILYASRDVDLGLAVWINSPVIQILELLPANAVTCTDYFTCAVLWSLVNKMEVIIPLTSRVAVNERMYMKCLA